MSVQTPDVNDVAGYAAAVRRALVGLGPEQVEDLTDGLEANLAEALADESTAGRGADPVSRFGTPEEYAAELGAAAGLGRVEEAPRRRRWFVEDLRHPVRALRRFGATVLERLRGHAWWSPLEAFLVSLRPVWWVLRGWVLWQLVHVLWRRYDEVWLPRSVAGVLSLAVLVVASVQWGRGRWQLPGRWRTVPLLVSTAAAVAAIPMLSTVSGSRAVVYVDNPSAGYATPAPQNGVWVDGMQVSNLFVYDAQGNPLSGVQVYDDRGRPVVATDDQGQSPWYLPGVAVPWSFVGVPDTDGRMHWNVYPRQGAPSDQFVWSDQTGLQELPQGIRPQDPPLPFPQAPTIVVPSTTSPDETATPTPGSTSTAGTGATGSPTGDPTSNASAGATTASSSDTASTAPTP